MTTMPKFQSHFEATAPSMKQSILYHLRFSLAHDPVTATKRDWWLATSKAVHERIIDRMIDTQAVHHDKEREAGLLPVARVPHGPALFQQPLQCRPLQADRGSARRAWPFHPRPPRRGSTTWASATAASVVSRPASSIRSRRSITRPSATASITSSASSGRSSKTATRLNIPTTGCATARRGKIVRPEFSQAVELYGQRREHF